jgi:hypothetical protein
VQEVTNVSLGRRLLLAAITVTGCTAIWLAPPVQNYFAHMVKLPQMRLPYTVALFTLLMIAMVLCSARWMMTARRLWIACAGACVGELAAVIAISFANLFLPRGVERSLGTLRTFGAFNVIAIDFAVAGVLGSWLLGAVAFTVYRALLRRGHRSLGTPAVTGLARKEGPASSALLL